MKKKMSREIFTIDPMEGELQPGEEKVITVKFQSQKELKLKTTKNESDIILNVFEGKSQEKHSQVPINVNVNAVFSKYSLTPLKNINFGPMTFGEQVTRTFEVRNEGLFEFKFALCDYKDDEAKKRIKEERLKEMEERIKGSEEKKEEVKDPKKKPEPAKAPPKKPDAKGGAPAAAPEGGALEVSQYTVSPAIGSIPPGSAAVFNVIFKAKGSQFYETTIALDIANRDPADNPDGIPFELCAESSIPGINTDDLDQIFEEQTVIPSLDPSLNT
jgi:hydrocephalus-inducing protein